MCWLIGLLLYLWVSPSDRRQPSAVWRWGDKGLRTHSALSDRVKAYLFSPLCCCRDSIRWSFGFGTPFLRAVLSPRLGLTEEIIKTFLAKHSRSRSSRLLDTTPSQSVYTKRPFTWRGHVKKTPPQGTKSKRVSFVRPEKSKSEPTSVSHFTSDAGRPETSFCE